MKSSINISDQSFATRLPVFFLECYRRIEGHGLIWFLFICWFNFNLILLINLCSAWLPVSGRNGKPSACPPDGVFNIYDAYNPWALSGFFQITLGFGDLSFSSAKAIDVLWDFVSISLIKTRIYC